MVASAVFIGQGFSYPCDVFPGRIAVDAAQNQTVIKDNITATTDPTGSDNFAANWSVGSKWYNTSAGKIWECYGDGQWKETTALAAPAGVDGSLQYKSGTAFAGDANLTWDANAQLVVNSPAGSPLTVRTAGQNALVISSSKTATFSGQVVINAATGNPLTAQANGVNALVIDSSKIATFGGNVYLPNGSVGFPALTFAGDINNGLYYITTDQWGICTAGITQLHFILGQKINAYQPICGKSDASAGFPTFCFSDDVNTGMYRSAEDQLSFSTGGAERMRIASNGVITAYGGTIYLTSVATGIYENAGSLNFYVGGQNRFNISAAGQINLGSGTYQTDTRNNGTMIINAVTGSPLTVQANSANALVIDASKNAAFSGTITSTGWENAGNGWNLTNHNTSTAANSFSALRLEAGSTAHGGGLLGSRSSDYLTAFGFVNGITIGPLGTDQDVGIRVYNTAAAGWRNALFVQNGTGNVGIGSTNPQAKLHVSGTASPLEALRLQNFQTNSGTQSVEASFWCLDNLNVSREHARIKAAMGSTAGYGRFVIQTLQNLSMVNALSIIGSTTYVHGSFSAGAVTINPTTGTPLTVQANSVNALVIDSSKNATFGGVIYLPWGTAISPSVAFSGDVDLGLYRYAENKLYIAADEVGITTSGGVASALKVGSFVVSNTFADTAPTNGLFVKGQTNLSATTINAATGNPLTVQANGVDALVVDSSKNATFEGTTTITKADATNNQTLTGLTIKRTTSDWVNITTQFGSAIMFNHGWAYDATTMNVGSIKMVANSTPAEGSGRTGYRMVLSAKAVGYAAGDVPIMYLQTGGNDYYPAVGIGTVPVAGTPLSIYYSYAPGTLLSVTANTNTGTVGQSHTITGLSIVHTAVDNTLVAAGFGSDISFSLQRPNAAGYKGAGRIRCYIEDTGSTYQPTALAFSTSVSGAASVTEYLTLSSTGRLTLSNGGMQRSTELVLYNTAAADSFKTSIQFKRDSYSDTAATLGELDFLTNYLGTYYSSAKIEVEQYTSTAFGRLKLYSRYAGVTAERLRIDNVVSIYAPTTINAVTGNPLTVQANSVDALVIDSSKTATFYGSVYLEGSTGNASLSLDRGSNTVTAARLYWYSEGVEKWQIGTRNNSTDDFIFYNSTLNEALRLTHASLGITASCPLLVSYGSPLIHVKTTTNNQTATLRLASLATGNDIKVGALEFYGHTDGSIKLASIDGYQSTSGASTYIIVTVRDSGVDKTLRIGSPAITSALPVTINPATGSPLTVQANSVDALVIDASKNATFSGNALPSTSGLTLGSSSVYWQDAYIGYRIFMGATTTYVMANAGAMYFYSGSTQRLTVSTGVFVSGPLEVNATASGPLTVKVSNVSALTIDSTKTATFGADVMLPSANYVYLGAANVDGSWRMGRSGNDLLMERRESGSWVTKQTIRESGAVAFSSQVYYTSEISASAAIDWRTGNRQKHTTSGDVTFTFTPPSGPTNCQLKLSYGGVHTPTFPTIKWAGGTEPVWTKVNGKTDIVTLYYDGTAWWGSAILDFVT